MSTTGIRWRYLRLLMGEDANIAWLDALGDQGWELVCRNLVSGQIGVYEWLFKRMVLEHPAIVPLPAAPEQTMDAAQVRDEGVARLEQQAQRKAGQWSEEARARARETRERNRQMQQMKALAEAAQDTVHDAGGNT